MGVCSEKGRVQKGIAEWQLVIVCVLRCKDMYISTFIQMYKMYVCTNNDRYGPGAHNGMEQK